jgi:hypothetical protein
LNQIPVQVMGGNPAKSKVNEGCWMIGGATGKSRHRPLEFTRALVKETGSKLEG